MVRAKTPDRSKPKAKKPPVTKNKVAGFLSIGPDSQFFQKAVEVANDSETASACIDVRSRFIQANGINDERLANMIVNRQGQTLDDVLSEIANNVAVGEVIPLIVGYTGLGQTCSIRAVPFENVLLAEPDDLNNINRAGIFPYLGSVLFKTKALKDYTELNLFNPDPDVVMSQIVAAGGIDKYPGQLVYVTFGKSGDGYYHIPRHFSTSAINNMETEYEITVYNYRTVSNGFAGHGFAVTVDDPAAKTDEDEDPAGDSDSIESQIEASMGNREAGNTLVLRFKTEKEANAFRWVDASGSQLANRYGATADQVATSLAKVFNVPLELANVRRAGSSLFASSDEENQTNRRMQASVNHYQRKIEQVLFRIFSHWHKPLPGTDFSIENQNYFANTNSATQAG